MILIFGIVGLVLSCTPFGIAAWVMGNADLKKMAAGQMDPTGQSITNAGKICGIISVILAIVGIILYVALGGAMLAGGGLEAMQQMEGIEVAP